MRSVTRLSGVPAFFSIAPETLASSRYSFAERPTASAADFERSMTVSAYFLKTDSDAPTDCWASDAARLIDPSSSVTPAPAASVSPTPRVRLRVLPNEVTSRRALSASAMTEILIGLVMAWSPQPS